MRAVAPTARTFELIAAIADRLALEADETVAAMDAAVIEVVPEFGADAAIAAEVTATNRGNWQQIPGGGAPGAIPAIGRGPT